MDDASIFITKYFANPNKECIEVCEFYFSDHIEAERAFNQIENTYQIEFEQGCDCFLVDLHYNEENQSTVEIGIDDISEVLMFLTQSIENVA